MRFLRTKEYLKTAYGKVPDVEYFTGDMEYISTYYEQCKAEQQDDFYIDETTWNDLNMDAVYQRINTGLSTAGEQYLYYMLHRPMKRHQFEQQNELVSLVENEPDTRQKLQDILYKVGSYRKVDITGVLRTQHTSPFWLSLYLLLVLMLPVSILLTVFCGVYGAIMMLVCLTVNGIVHEVRMHQCDLEIRTVNYCVGLACALRKIQKMQHPLIDPLLEDSYLHLNELHSVLNIGPVVITSKNDMMSIMMTTLLLDLITFELLKNRLAKHHKDFFVIHEAVGQVDAAIAIASFRKSMASWCIPQIDFETSKAFIHAKQVIHPLVDNPVPNDIALDRPLLITGANASGKSTYLKASILCALLAQTICTAPCATYHASHFRLYTSMAISDNIRSGESYYIAEIKSLKRILDETGTRIPVLCAIDEVLRGTNTIERIAASTELLKALANKGILCIAATHDAELCNLVDAEYEQAHFQETLTEDTVLFDYQIKPGMATTRNAIDLLKLIGFDADIVAAAHNRANSYIQTGQWSIN